ncbi:hypothetical protein [Mycobacterium sp. E2479]|nr:hypothetical protein [Mycobacterium sp. E2479]
MATEQFDRRGAERQRLSARQAFGIAAGLMVLSLIVHSWSEGQA